jgi:Flp pilus assembly pilin Flp
MRQMLNFLRREDGATAVEYAAALALLVLALGAATKLNQGTQATFNSSSGQMGVYDTTTTTVGH